MKKTFKVNEQTTLHIENEIIALSRQAFDGKEHVIFLSKEELQNILNEVNK